MIVKEHYFVIEHSEGSLSESSYEKGSQNSAK